MTPQISRHSDGPAKEVVATTQYLGPLSIMTQWDLRIFEVVFHFFYKVSLGFEETSLLSFLSKFLLELIALSLKEPKISCKNE